MNGNENRQKGYFIRLFCNTLNDPAIAKMSDKLFRFYIYLNLLAKEECTNGRIERSLNEISWRFHLRKSAVEKCINSLIKAGFIAVDNSAIIISGWNEAQYGESYERVKRFRERHTPDNGNGSWNGCETIKEEAEANRETDSKSEAKKEEEAKADSVSNDETEINQNLVIETELESDDEIIARLVNSENNFDKTEKEPNPDATTGYPVQYLFRRFQEEFPFCPWKPENCVDVIRKIIACRMWTVKEVEEGIKWLASRTPTKNANPRQLLAHLNDLSQSGNTEQAHRASIQKQKERRREEERILHENEEWERKHGKYEKGWAIRELNRVLEEGKKTGQEKPLDEIEASENKNKEKEMDPTEEIACAKAE